VVVNKPFKKCLCDLYGEWLLSGNCLLIPLGKIKKLPEALFGVNNECIRGRKVAMQTIFG
jgi:hypothetical protein